MLIRRNDRKWPGRPHPSSTILLRLELCSISIRVSATPPSHHDSVNRDREDDANDEKPRFAHDTGCGSRRVGTSACASMSVPNEWIDRTQRPTKIPAILSS